MNSQARRLPSRFPVGTRYVIEGQNGRIGLRYLVFPNGKHLELPTETGRRAPRRQQHPRRTGGRK
jgi:hypothetical protein